MAKSTPTKLTAQLHPWGPTWVAFGALLWATDALFRSQLVADYSPLWIVFISHLLCLAVSLPFSIQCWRKWSQFRWSDWSALLVLSGGGSVLAMILFTYAFSHTSNYTVPILIQKLQPLIAIILARLLLRESWQKGFGLVLIFALSGAVLISWPAQGQGPAWQGQDFLAIAAAFGAALTWGGSTVAGRHLISKFGFLEITAVRYFMAFLILLPVIGLSGGAVNLGSIPLSDWGLFLMMAWGPGYLALIIFYKGLSGTQASVATLCELAFPVGAVLINWVFLDSPLSGQQILGAVLLVGSVTWLSYSQARLQRRAVVETPFERMILGCKKK